MGNNQIPKDENEKKINLKKINVREKIFSQSRLPRLIHDMRYKIGITNSFKKKEKKT
jgi:hypothetical protein